MPVLLTQPYVPPVEPYDRVHLDQLTITIERTDYARIQVQARVRLYRQDADGHKTFSPELVAINIDDAQQWVIELAQKGDMRGVAADAAIKQIVATLVALKTPFGDAEVA